MPALEKIKPTVRIQKSGAVKKYRNLYAVILACLLITTSCTGEGVQEIPADDTMTFHEPLYPGPAPEIIRFSSCMDGEWFKSHQKYFNSTFGDDVDISCAPELPNGFVLARIGGAEYCQESYCQTLIIDQQEVKGRTTGSKLPDTRGDFLIIKGDEPECGNPKTKCDPVSLVELMSRNIRMAGGAAGYGAIKETNWNYIIDTRAYGKIAASISVPGLAGMAIDVIDHYAN